MTEARVPGYLYGDPSLDPSPISREEFERIQRVALFGPEDVEALRRAGRILERHVEELLDVWYGFVGSHDFLVAFFAGSAGPDGGYLESVRRRFARWVVDTCTREYDEEWLAYQHEIGRRHYDRKNRTDGIADAPPQVDYRYLLPLVYPIYATVRPFLEREEQDRVEVDRMHQAWLKAVILSVTLWSQPYLRPGAF